MIHSIQVGSQIEITECLEDNEFKRSYLKIGNVYEVVDVERQNQLVFVYANYCITSVPFSAIRVVKV
ncbi:hypothetical protein ACSMFR_02330 [Listeria aquatica]|uniref:hypothetical protein n=1 Tax=Listeria aquatica TaxID=1494960 RepID=UPI003F70FFB8